MIERAAYCRGVARAWVMVELQTLAPWVIAVGVGQRLRLETLVFRSGTCSLPARVLVKALQSFHPKANVTVEADAKGLRINRFVMSPVGFHFRAAAPEAFQDVTADAWLAPKGPLAPPSANVPCAAPDETAQPPEDRQRW